MKSLHVISLLALAGCAVSTADTSKGVSVELASVTLADECGRPPPPPAAPAPTTPARPAKSSDMDAPTKPGAVTPGHRGYCNQTSMQLMIKTPAGIAPTLVKIKKVELLDDKGKLLEVLSSRSPRMWADSKYSSWDEKLVANQNLQAQYDLTTPDWNKLTGGRWNAHTKAFQVRVTVTIGGANKTVEKQSITPARLPPAVPT